MAARSDKCVQRLSRVRTRVLVQGSPREAAQALSKVSGVPVTCGMAMPMFFRWLFLFELHKVSAGVHRVDPSA